MILPEDIQTKVLDNFDIIKIYTDDYEAQEVIEIVKALDARGYSLCEVDNSKWRFCKKQ